MTCTTQKLKCANTDPRGLSMATTQTLKSKGSNAQRKAIAAAEFPARLAEVHDGRISLRDEAVYNGARKPIAVVCNTCGHEWEPLATNLIQYKKGCPACARQRTRNRAGTVRSPRASAAKKAFAIACRQAGMSYCAIGRMLNKGDATILKWCDPAAHAKDIERGRQWRDANRERHNANVRRWSTEFAHGKSAKLKNSAKRRALEANAVFDIPDGERLITVDMWSVIKDDPVGQALFISDSDAAAYAELRREGDRLFKETGIKYEVDHLVPLSRGGLHCIENFQLKTAEDNNSKLNSVRPEDYALFAQRIFGLTETPNPSENYEIKATQAPKPGAP